MFPNDFLMLGSYIPSSTSSLASYDRSPWSRSQDKLFEQAIAIFPDGTPDRWRKIAGHVPGKTPWEVREHYEALVYDVSEIDSGRVQLPRYEDDDSFSPSWASDCGSQTNQIEFGGSKSKNSEMERKKGVPWTEEEHKLFLIGLQRYGKGDWRSISRNAVVSRTPTQVASHAQKYYLRLNSMKKEKTKRSSIHDITTVDTFSVAPPSNDQTRVGVESSSNESNSSKNEMGSIMGPPRSRSFLDQGCSSSGYQHLGFPM